MHAISSYRGNRPTNIRRPPASCKHANTQTGPITIHCATKLSNIKRKLATCKNIEVHNWTHSSWRDIEISYRMFGICFKQ